MIGSSVMLSDSDQRVSQLVAASRSHRLVSAEAEELAEHALDCAREEEAIPVLRSLLRSGTEPVVLRHWLGLLHRALDEHDVALVTLEQASRLAPRDPGIAHTLARTALEAGLPAVAFYARALSLAPTDSAILLGRASARLAAGELNEASQELDDLLIQHPGWYAGHEALVQLRWTRGDRAGFVQSILRALTTAPKDPALWRLLLRSLMHAKRYEDVLAATAQARRAMGPDPHIAIQEASAVSALGDIGHADRLFDAMTGRGDLMGTVHQVRHLLRAGRPDAAAALANACIDQPGNEHVWPYLALAWRLLDDARYQWLLGDPALVGVYDIGADCGDLALLGDRLRGLHKTTHQHLDQSVRGGTQTDGPLFSRIDPAIRQLRIAIARQVSEHVRRLPPVDPRHPVLRQRRDRPIRFSGSWSVRLTGSGHHAHHVHPAGWFSSAFYVSLPGESEGGPPPAGWLTLGAPPEELGLDLQPVGRIEPRPGRLVLFPSILWHGTEPFGAGERLTVACDVALPVGTIHS